MIQIEGDTYHARKLLQSLGGSYDPSRKVWLLPDDKEEIADALLQKMGIRYYSRFVPDSDCSKETRI